MNGIFYSIHSLFVLLLLLFVVVVVAVVVNFSTCNVRVPYVALCSKPIFDLSKSSLFIETYSI